MPFRLRHTGPPIRDQYVIVGGGHALFEREEKSRRPAVYRRLDRSPGNSLPAQLTATQAARS
jgi:hypothetical protein